jgi:hypothetical protein
MKKKKKRQTIKELLSGRFLTGMIVNEGILSLFAA